MKKIIFIYAENCPDCKRMRDILESVKDSVRIIEYECEEKEAIDVALEHNIEDLPGCWVDGQVFQGENFDEEKLKGKVLSIAE